MTRRLLIACGAAETRAALMRGEEAIAFWFGPARGDERLPRAPSTGDVFAGRVRIVSKPLNGAFVDIGAAREAFLPLRKGETPVEGARLIAIVRRPPIGAKGAVLSTDWRRDLDPAAAAAVEKAARDATPGALADADAATMAARAISRRLHRLGASVDEILIDDAAAAGVLRATVEAPARIAAGAFESAGIDAFMDAAFERVISLSSGARLTLDETEALTVVDIDAGAAADGAGARLNDRVNAAAAAMLFPELARRGIGGRIVVDFLPPSGAAARKALLDTVKNAKFGVFECRLGRLSEDGLFDLTAPRERLSLLEQATEPAGAGWPRQGRRFTLDWQAKSAVRALERRLRAAPSSRPRLLVGAEIGDYLAGARPQWGARLAERYGARFAISAHATGKERDFDLAE